MSHSTSSIPPPTSNTCGQCAAPWSDCPCPAEARTESVHSLLSHPGIPCDSRHLCVFLYHTYHRWTAAAHDADFSAACLPPWEGWYAAWLKPSGISLHLPPRSERLALPCSVHYANGTCAAGYIEPDGRLTVELPAPRPPDAADYDPDRHVLTLRPAVSQALSQTEVDAHTRGFVHTRAKVSHIVAQVPVTDVVQVLQLPGPAAEQRRRIVVDAKRVRDYTPHLVEELQWRMRRRFTKKFAVSVQRLLCLLVQRAAREDRAARYALRRGWLQAHKGPSKQLKVLREKVRKLANVSSLATDRSDGALDDLRRQGDAQSSTKRARQA